MKYFLLTFIWFGLSLSVFSQNLSRDTYKSLDEVEQLHSQINRCSAIVVVSSAGIVFFPPAAVVTGAAVVIRFFKVNRHRRLTNKLIRVSLK